jgi:uncharacterized protein
MARSMTSGTPCRGRARRLAASRGVALLLPSILVCVAWVATTRAQPPPPELTRPVNDFADVIPPEIERELIRALQAASGDVVVVATVTSVEPWGDIRMYANEMFENHGKGIGQKGRDNGLLVLLAVEDRRVWTEVGYDLESIITDGFAGQISRQVMVPRFREGDYGGGLLDGVTAYIQRIAEARNVSLENVPAVQRDVPEEDGGFPIILAIVLVMLALNGLSSLAYGLTGRRRGRRRRWMSTVGPFGPGYGWPIGTGGRSGGFSGFGGGFSGFGGGRSGGGGGGASW